MSWRLDGMAHFGESSRCELLLTVCFIYLYQHTCFTMVQSSWTRFLQFLVSQGEKLCCSGRKNLRASQIDHGGHEQPSHSIRWGWGVRWASGRRSMGVRCFWSRFSAWLLRGRILGRGIRGRIWSMVKVDEGRGWQICMMRRSGYIYLHVNGWNKSLWAMCWNWWLNWYVMITFSRWMLVWKWLKELDI